MFKFEMKGFDKVHRHLDDMAKRAAVLDGKQQAVSLSELLNDDFIAEHSSFSSFDEVLYPCGIFSSDPLNRVDALLGFLSNCWAEIAHCGSQIRMAHVVLNRLQID